MLRIISTQLGWRENWTGSAPRAVAATQKTRIELGSKVEMSSKWSHDALLPTKSKRRCAVGTSHSWTREGTTLHNEMWCLRLAPSSTNSLSKGYPHPEDHDKPITRVFVQRKCYISVTTGTVRQPLLYLQHSGGQLSSTTANQPMESDVITAGFIGETS